jgi:hypothetical protein
LGRRDQFCHGVGSEFRDDLLGRHREGDAQGQTQLDRIPQKYQEMRALGIWATGARSDEKPLPIERMGGIVNGYDLWIVIE